MGTGINFKSESKDIGPIIPTHVLNTDECNVVAVGANFGNLAYRERGRWFATTSNIHHVIFLRSIKHNQNRLIRSTEADFDIYLTDGRVIEVHSFDRATIQAALVYAPVKDVRAKFRRMRGR
jgi:hypothetical protein